MLNGRRICVKECTPRFRNANVTGEEGDSVNKRAESMEELARMVTRAFENSARTFCSTHNTFEDFSIHDCANVSRTGHILGDSQTINRACANVRALAMKNSLGARAARRVRK